MYVYVTTMRWLPEQTNCENVKKKKKKRFGIKMSDLLWKSRVLEQL